MFQIGDKIEARMPGSRLYSQAEVLETKGTSCLIKFGDGAVHQVQEIYIRPVTKTVTRSRRNSRSPARRKPTEVIVSDLSEDVVKTNQKSLDEALVGVKPEIKKRIGRSPGRPSTAKSTTKMNTRSKSRGRVIRLDSGHDESEAQQPKKVVRRSSVNRSTKLMNNAQNLWSEQHSSASVVLRDILHSSRSNSRQSSCTNSELEMIDQNIAERESPVLTEEDFRRSDIEDTVSEVYMIQPRNMLRVTNRSTRQKSATPDEQNVEPIIHEKEATPLNPLNTEISDSDEEVKNVHNKDHFIVIKMIKFLLTAFLISGTPLICMYLYNTCNIDKCVFRYPQVTDLNNLELYFSKQASMMNIAFLSFLTVFSIIRIFGTSAFGFPTRDGVLNYYFNGFFSIIIITVIFTLLHRYNFPILQYIHEQDFRLIISSLICAFLISLILHLRKYYVSMVPSIMEPKRNTISEFWNGCELNPRIFSIFDVKLIYYRMAIMGTILLLTAYVHEDAWNLIRNVLYGEATDYNSTLILVTALNIFFHLDLVFHEKQLTATFEIQNEGTGFMLLLKDNLYPFVTAFPVKYILYRNIRAPSIALAFIVGMFFVGYLLFRYSNNMKYAVRINPADYRINYKDLYITFSGKKLLLAKTWGFVRHPNYLGHIMVLVSFSLALLWSAPFNVISFLPLIISVIFLLHRAARDGRQCEKKHGASWTRYCNVVKYKIVPHIY